MNDLGDFSSFVVKFGKTWIFREFLGSKTMQHVWTKNDVQLLLLGHGTTLAGAGSHDSGSFYSLSERFSP